MFSNNIWDFSRHVSEGVTYTCSLWWWLPLRLSKRQSTPTTVLRTTLQTRTITQNHNTYTCSFAANYHHNFPHQLPSDLVAQLLKQGWCVPGGRGFEPHRDQRFFLFLACAAACLFCMANSVNQRIRPSAAQATFSPCGSISFLGITLRRHYLGYL